MWVAQLEGEVVGMVGILRARVHRKEPIRALATVERLYIKPAFRGYSVGKRLLSVLLEFAKEQGYQKVCLYTVDVVYGMLAFYSSFGFKLSFKEPKNGLLGVVNRNYYVLELY